MSSSTVRRTWSCCALWPTHGRCRTRQTITTPRRLHRRSMDGQQPCCPTPPYGQSGGWYDWNITQRKAFGTTTTTKKHLPSRWCPQPNATAASCRPGSTPPVRTHRWPFDAPNGGCTRCCTIRRCQCNQIHPASMRSLTVVPKAERSRIDVDVATQLLPRPTLLHCHLTSCCTTTPPWPSEHSCT